MPVPPVVPPSQPSPPPQVIYQPVPVNAIDTNSNTNGSNADSESRSVSGNEISNQNSNIQINNTSNVVKSRGLELPTTTLNVNGYYSSGGGNYRDNFGVVVGVSIPLTGKGGKAVAAQMEAESRQAVVEQSSKLASTCRAIVESGVIIDYSKPEFEPIAACQYVKANRIVAQAPQVQQIDYRSEIDQLRRENQQLREDLQKFNRRVETTTPVPAMW
jgi:hypothetical protein